MPTYEYKCTSCGEIAEYFQKMTDAPIEKCESCGGKLKRLISGGVRPIFKGSGFYQTDYKDKKDKPVSVESTKDKKPEKKTTTKPDSKSE